MKHTRTNKCRALYTGSRRFDRSCRNAGTCNYCRANRLRAQRRQLLEAADEASVRLPAIRVRP